MMHAAEYLGWDVSELRPVSPRVLGNVNALKHMKACADCSVSRGNIVNVHKDRHICLYKMPFTALHTVYGSTCYSFARVV